MTRRAMLIPKPSRRRRYIPALPDFDLSHVIGKLAPSERKAMARICDTADLLMVEDKLWLLVPADTRLIDTLAAFGAEAEDRENDLEDEPQADDEPSLGGLECTNQQAWAHGCCSSDLELDQCDKEPDDPEARKGFIKARQGPGFTYGGITGGLYNSTNDWKELRRAKSFVAGKRRPATA